MTNKLCKRSNGSIPQTSSMLKKKPELMSPAGDWVMLRVAVKSGADAVYLGVDRLNMRAKAKNFSIEELPEIVEFCHKNRVKVYLTVNTIIKEDESEEVDAVVISAKKAKVDMIICWDFAVIVKCKEHNIPFCISTQASISNSLSAKMYASLGASRIVLARECTLADIVQIRKEVDIEIETFIHGAMCVAVSGRCFLSHHIFGKSANQGECLQSCRREYEIYDKRMDKTLLLGSDYVMSAKDLCTITFLDELIAAGIDSFKIEGRKRSPEYVDTVTKTYRNAIDLHFEGKLDIEHKKNFFVQLSKVYNRGMSKGFYFGAPDGNDFSELSGNASEVKKEFVAKVLNYYKKSKICHIEMITGEIRSGDKLLIFGKTTGMVECIIEGMIEEGKLLEVAERGNQVTFKCPDVVRVGDQVYVVKVNMPLVKNTNRNTS